MFSFFPNGLPGKGLLLLRLTLGAGLFADAAARFHGSDIPLILAAVGEILTAALLLIGLWIPIVALLVCVLQLGMLALAGGTVDLYLMRAALGVCVAVLGPGAWSVDARLFGRRRVEIKSLHDN